MWPKELDAERSGDTNAYRPGPRAYCPICHIFEPGTHGPRCAGLGEGEIVGYGPLDRDLVRS